jgi:uncharacterized membrane protein YphA (DoxX/SURF4 family)
MDSLSTVSESMPARTLPRTLLLIGRIALGLVFLYAAYSKLYFNGSWHLNDYQFFFGMVIDSYHILPIDAVQIMGRLLPWVEFVLGVLLIAGVWVRWAAAAASLLLVVFIAAMWRAKILGLEINCGCFGNNEKLGNATLIRDTGFLLFSLAITAAAFLLKKPSPRVSS